MENKNMMNDNYNELKPEEISCRIQQVNEGGVSLLLYITSRAAQKKLDEKYGELSWSDDYKMVGDDRFCFITVDTGEKLITRGDVGTESYTEKVKGQSSDAFKRACVKFGIGRELYSAPRIFIENKYVKIKKNKNDKFVTYDTFTVRSITYKNGIIDGLVIQNQDLNVVYEQYENKTIDDIKYKTLIDACEQAEVEPEKIRETFGLKSIRDMDIRMYVKAIRKLEKNIEEKKKES